MTKPGKAGSYECTIGSILAVNVIPGVVGRRKGAVVREWGGCWVKLFHGPLGPTAVCRVVCPYTYHVRSCRISPQYPSACTYYAGIATYDMYASTPVHVPMQVRTHTHTHTRASAHAHAVLSTSLCA